MNQTKKEGFSIFHDFIINSSSAKVFEAISLPKHLVNWWPEKCTGTPAEGEEYNFQFTEQYDWYARVIKCTPTHAFHLRMTKSDKDWNPTTFGFDLSEVNGNVKVKFWHVGWPECNDHYKHSCYCWAILLQGLKNYVEKGEVIPFEERE